MAQGGRAPRVPKVFRNPLELPKFPTPGPIKKLMKDYNYIKEMNTIPCAVASPEIYIKTFAATAPPALLSLFVPGCTDIVKTKLGLSPWHARGLSGMIKKAVPPQALGAKQFLYKIGYFTAEKYLWFLMVADVTKEFSMTWQSQVYQYQQCQLPGAGTAYGYFPPFVYGAISDQGLDIVPIKTVPGISCGLSSIQIAPGFQGNIGYSMTWDTYPIRGKGCNVATWFTEEGDDAEQDFSWTQDPESSQGNTTGGSFWAQNKTISQPKTYRFWMASDSEDNVQVLNSSWSCSLQGRRHGLTHFGCFPKAVDWPYPRSLGELLP